MTHTIVGVYMAKDVMQVHWVDQETGEIALFRTNRSDRLLCQRSAALPPCPAGKKYKSCHGTAEATSESPQPGEHFDWPRVEHLSSDMQGGPVHSPLSQRLTRDGTAVEIEIYEDGQGGWLLEIVDEFANSTVWDDAFLTDSAALAEALNTIDSEGIASVTGTGPAGIIRH
jgi:uncharacterized protein